jgi:SagB-type dehydrogenase family enzyme
MFRLERPVIQKFAGQGVHSAIRPPASLSEMFHENTKLGAISARAYGTWIAHVGRSAALKALMARPYKVYSLADRVPLEPPVHSTYLEKVIGERRSLRSFDGRSISKAELSRLLFYSYGRTASKRTTRAVASGGGLYPLELYAVALNVENCSGGIYHYDPEHHGLDVLLKGNYVDRIKESIWFEEINVDEAAVLVIITAMFQRNTVKYKDRGYRMILMEAGEVAQNMSLVVTSLGLGACLIGGFNDDAVSSLLDIDGCDEAPLLPIVIGHPVINPESGSVA